MALALDHLRILDLTDEQSAGCGRLLAELGADVIKVEPPGGDRTRSRGPFAGGKPHAERSLRFLHYNGGKRSIVIDLEASEGQRAFAELVRRSDAVVESFAPGELDALGLGYEQLAELNPGIVLTSITPFGQSGPQRDWKGDDLIANAMGGLTYVAGEPGQEPCSPPLDQSYQMAGAHAAWGTLLALFNRWGDGRGQHVDVSLQEVTAHEYFMIAVYSAPYSTITERAGGGSRWPPNLVYPARDGLVRISVFQPHQYRRLAEWTGDEVLLAPELESREMRAAAADLIDERIGAWTSQHTVDDLIDEAQQRRVPMAPMYSPAEFVESAYARARGLFVKATHPAVGAHRTLRPHLRFGRTPPRDPAPAPLLDEHGDEIRSWLATAEDRAPAAAPHLAATAASPFEGVRVLDFTRVWAGPYGARLLADHGAEVIKVESAVRPDSRPEPDASPQAVAETNARFCEINRNKLGIAVDLTTERGRELIRELAARCDLVVENTVPGVMERLGLAYEQLRAVNRELIYISLPGFGEGTPHSDLAAFGGTLMCYTGMSYLWGQPDTPPQERCQLAYPDYITAGQVPLFTLAALHHRAKTGEGQLVEIPQIDGVAAYMGLAYLDHAVNGNAAGPIGNRSVWAAPRGVYRCRGHDRWVAISVRDDDEWRGLCTATGLDDLGRDPRFASVDGRLAHHGEIDTRLGEWTGVQTPRQCARVLQDHGVPAGVVQSGEDLYHDPHLRARGYVLPIEHPGLGSFEHAGFTVGLSATPASVQRPAPALGADTEEVFTRILGMPAGEVRRLSEDGVLA